MKVLFYSSYNHHYRVGGPPKGMVRGFTPEHCTHPCVITTVILIRVIVAKIMAIVTHGGWWIVGRGLGLGFEVRGLRGSETAAIL